MTKHYHCELQIDLPSARIANDMARILAVDRQDTVDFKPKDSRLVITVQTASAKLLRVIVSSCYDHLQVLLKCYQEFDNFDDG